MDGEKTKQISFYILIIGLLFVIISFIVPWGTIDASIGYFKVGQVDFYPFGIHAVSGSISNWSLFSDFDSLKALFSISEFTNLELPFAMYIAIFPVMVLLFIITIAEILTYNRKKKNYDISLASGFCAVATLFLFYIFINFGLFSISFGISLKPYFDFSMGFYFMLFAGILFFISFFIERWSDNLTQNEKWSTEND